MHNFKSPISLLLPKPICAASVPNYDRIITVYNDLNVVIPTLAAKIVNTSIEDRPEYWEYVRFLTQELQIAITETAIMINDISSIGAIDNAGLSWKGMQLCIHVQSAVKSMRSEVNLNF